MPGNKWHEHEGEAREDMSKQKCTGFPGPPSMFRSRLRRRFEQKGIGGEGSSDVGAGLIFFCFLSATWPEIVVYAVVDVFTPT